MQNYVVTPEFKTRVTDILNTKKFTSVFAFMNLINREGFIFTEAELNQTVQFLGEFPYNEVAELFNRLPVIVTQETENEGISGEPEVAPAPKGEKKESVRKLTKVEEPAN
jgi:hypothetical protein